MSRKFQPSLPVGQLRGEMEPVEKVALRILVLCAAIVEGDAELHDAANSSISGNGSVSSGKRGFSVSDMTGEIATSPPHGYMRRQLRVAATHAPELRRRLKHVEKTLNDMETVLKRAIPVALDPQLRENLARADEADLDYRKRHAHKA